VFYVIYALLAALLLVILYIVSRQRNLARRDRAMRRLLDGADTLEAQLLECRARMQQLKAMLVALPEEMSADANAGLRDLLAHRLWIKQHAATASRADLDAALAAIDTSREVLAAQLARLDSITGELAAAQSSARSVGRRGKST
jgi:hypothetical protein